MKKSPFHIDLSNRAIVYTPKLPRLSGEHGTMWVAESIAPQGPASPEPDNRLNKIIKYIPSEVITFILAIDALMKGHDLPSAIYWGVFVAGIFGTYRLTSKFKNVEKKQVFISTIAYCLWIMTIGAGPFSPSISSWYSPIYGQLGLIIYAFVIALFF